MSKSRDVDSGLDGLVCYADFGWFSGEFIPYVLKPPKHEWFWAMDRESKKVVGAGMFMPDTFQPWSFWINGIGYPVENFFFVKAIIPEIELDVGDSSG